MGIKNPRPAYRCFRVDEVGRGCDRFSPSYNREPSPFVLAVEKVFSFRPDWHQDDQAKPLVRQYQTTLESVLQADSVSSNSQLQNRVAYCVHCGIRFLTWPQNVGRQDLRCPFGCRKHHRKQSSNQRSADYYQTDKGKEKKRRLNAKRSSTPSPPNRSDRQPRQLAPPESPHSKLPHEFSTEACDEFSVQVELYLQGVTLDEGTLTGSPMLPYVRMMVNLIDGLTLSRDELVAALQKRVRQHSMSKRRRIDYVLRFLHQHPP